MIDMEQLREVHSDYIPDGYVNSDIDDIITELKGIWKYASLDLHVANDCKKTPEEYIVILIRMWDYLDTLPIQKVESAIVELDGKIITNQKDILRENRKIDMNLELIKELQQYGACLKAIRTNLEQYLAVRIEQDKELQ